MTPEQFINLIRKEIIDANLHMYKDLFVKYEATNVPDKYWQEALELYASLPEYQQAVLLKIIRQVMVDTSSNILGVIDGTVGTSNREDLVLVSLPGSVPLSGDLQDILLEAEEIEEA